MSRASTSRRLSVSKAMGILDSKGIGRGGIRKKYSLTVLGRMLLQSKVDEKREKVLRI